MHAVLGGRVRRVAAFYADTWAVEVRHDDGTLVRYCEVAPTTDRKGAAAPAGRAPVRVGQRLERGEPFALVGVLRGIVVPSNMLHLELYRTQAPGALTVAAGVSGKTVSGVPFLRRADLIDPTPALLAAEMP